MLKQRAKNKPSTNHRLRVKEEVISMISPVQVRLLKSNLTKITELQSRENVSMNFLLNGIVEDYFKKNERRTRLLNH